MSASITAPRGLQTLNPSPEISRYYNKANAPYTNTAQVLSEVLLAVRYVGQTFLVVDEEWWFKSGKLNTDLVLKQDSGTGITDLDYTPSPTQGTVTSSTGTDATISLADNTNAGLMSPSDKETLYDNVIYRSGTEVGKPIGGDLEVFAGFNLKTKNANEDDFNGLLIDESMVSIGARISTTDYSLIQVDGNGIIIYNNDLLSKGLVSDRLFNKQSDPNAFIQLGDIAQLEENVFNLELNKADLVGGLVPSSQLPAYVDDVLELANLASFPVTGEVGKIYVALDSNKQYRWSGSSYIQITNGLIASTDDVPEGSNLYFTTARVLATVLTGLSLVTGGAIVSTDSVLVAFGKIQKQLNDFGTALGLKQDELTDTNFGTFTNSVADKNTQSDTDALAYVDITTGKWVKQTFSKLVDYLKGFFVDKTTAQTIDGIKTFTASPIVPTATSDSHAINFGQAKGLGKMHAILIDNNIGDVVQHTGTTMYTIVKSYILPAGFFTSDCVFETDLTISKIGTAGNIAIGFGIAPSGTTLPIHLTNATAGNRYINIGRKMTMIKNGLIIGFGNSGNFYSDKIANGGALNKASTFDPTISNTFNLEIQLANASDIALLENLTIKVYKNA